jgi:hypothetical protein
MTAADADLLCEAAAEIDRPCATYRRYSGRMMFGKEVAAVVLGDLSDLPAIAARAARVDPGLPDRLRGLKTDNLGLQLVAYIPTAPADAPARGAADDCAPEAA